MTRRGGGHEGRPSSAAIFLLVLASVAAACTSDGDAARPPKTSGRRSTTTAPRRAPKPAIRAGAMSIQVLSSQPDRVTGGDARISVTPPQGADASAVRVSVDGRDVTPRLRRVGTKLEGTVSGFVEGTSTLTASAGGLSVQRQVRDYPLSGPVISGPHLPLVVCTTELFGLGRATDQDCFAPTRVTYRYVSTDGTMKDLPEPSARPADLARSTIKGRDVPLVVREERGVINRSVYFLATVDPTPGAADIDQSDAAWNGRLVYRFGGGCGASYSQGAPLTTVDEPKMLAEGYAIATATFNTFQVQCNDVVSAETVMMVKERFIEEFGVPAHTIGEGASGGAIQQQLIIQNYPGLLDGAAAILPLPDAVTVAPGATDCGLLNRFYGTAEGATMTADQRAAVNGHATAATCDNWVRSFLAGLDPTAGCDPAIPRSQIYDPTTKRNGLRCTVQDVNANQLGRDPRTGFARRPLDNVGVQYGLEALNAGSISGDQFLALNEAMGGYDIDGRYQARREEADPEALRAAYETGRVSAGAGDQRQVPIIEVNIYTDPLGDIHDRFRAFSLRDRLTGGNDKMPRPEAAPGLQIWTRPLAGGTLADAVGNVRSGGGLGPEAVDAVDSWLDRLDRDRSPGDRQQELARTRPPEATDNCLDGGGQRLAAVDLYAKPGPCTTPYPIHGDPRTAAGAPRSDDVLKCQLKPVDGRDYRLPFNDEQLGRLRRIFPTGVCDWTRAGVGQGRPRVGDRTYDNRNDPAARA